MHANVQDTPGKEYSTSWDDIDRVRPGLTLEAAYTSARVVGYLVQGILNPFSKGLPAIKHTFSDFSEGARRGFANSKAELDYISAHRLSKDTKSLLETLKHQGLSADDFDEAVQSADV